MMTNDEITVTLTEGEQYTIIRALNCDKEQATIAERYSIEDLLDKLDKLRGLDK